jgi:hypothetical protein
MNTSTLSSRITTFHIVQNLVRPKDLPNAHNDDDLYTAQLIAQNLVRPKDLPKAHNGHNLYNAQLTLSGGCWQ